MSENTATTLAKSTISEDVVLSPAVAAIMERANTEATEIIERFASNEKNPIWYYLRDANATIACIMGKGKHVTNPQYFSQMITLKKQFREQEQKTTKETDYNEKKAA